MTYPLMDPHAPPTKYEITWLIKTRAEQLSKSELPMTLIPVDMYDPIDIAEKEYKDNVLLKSGSASKNSPPYRKKPP